MRRILPWPAVLAGLLAACAAQPAPALPATSTPVLPPAAIEIRFGVVGELRDANVWSLFDQPGAGYANYAAMSGYWPRLYSLSIPDRQFLPLTARGLPAPVTQDGGDFAGAVSLRTDLAWTDGSPFTADDVAFTVNTAIAFQLGFDWKAYFDFEALGRAEAVDAGTVRFHFKRAPDVGLWQYGALQGPVVQRAYWSPRIAAAAQLLPEASLTAQVESLKVSLAEAQARVDQLQASLNAGAPGTGPYQQMETELKRAKDLRNQTAARLAPLQTANDSALDAARAALYALPHEDEPTLGVWMPAGRQAGTWLNAANPAFPFGRPNFERASYRPFEDEEAAVSALEENEVDVLLAPDGLSKEIVFHRVEERPPLLAAHNAGPSARFIAINPSSTVLADPVFRRVLYCQIVSVPSRISAEQISIESFVSKENVFWQNPELNEVCGPYSPSRQATVELLKAAGYTWQTEPTESDAGVGLILPDGTSFPAIVLLAPAEPTDSLQTDLTLSLEQAAAAWGITIRTRLVSPEAIRYAVYSSYGYDMAIIGYRLSAYPGYLCDWFQEGNPFGYSSEDLRRDCVVLANTSDLEAARALIFEIQSILVRDLPLIPLYEAPTFDAYRNITYPFGSVPGGLSGVYGAPALAIPVQ
jgi:ABC-type transport system substrate-binding protein